MYRKGPRRHVQKWSKETCTKKDLGGMEQTRSKETCTNMRKETRSQAARRQGAREEGDMEPGGKGTWTKSPRLSREKRCYSALLSTKGQGICCYGRAGCPAISTSGKSNFGAMSNVGRAKRCGIGVAQILMVSCPPLDWSSAGTMPLPCRKRAKIPAAASP